MGRKNGGRKGDGREVTKLPERSLGKRDEVEERDRNDIDKDHDSDRKGPRMK
jgi:hypothetical protein